MYASSWKALLVVHDSEVFLCEDLWFAYMLSKCLLNSGQLTDTETNLGSSEKSDLWNLSRLSIFKKFFPLICQSRKFDLHVLGAKVFPFLEKSLGQKHHDLAGKFGVWHVMCSCIPISCRRLISWREWRTMCVQTLRPSWTFWPVIASLNLCVPSITPKCHRVPKPRWHSTRFGAQIAFGLTQTGHTLRIKSNQLRVEDEQFQELLTTPALLKQDWVISLCHLNRKRRLMSYAGMQMRRMRLDCHAKKRRR